MSYQLYNGDCLDVLESLEPVAVLFADPPDNIGLGYDSYRDRMDESDYVTLLRRWLNAFVLKARTVWFSYNSKWTFEVGKIVTEIVGCGPATWRPSPASRLSPLGSTTTTTWGTTTGRFCGSAGATPRFTPTPSAYRVGDKRMATSGPIPAGASPGMSLISPGSRATASSAAPGIQRNSTKGWSSGASS